MNIGELNATARAMVARNRGILAADESNSTIKRRFDAIKLESTEENRRAYREMLFTSSDAQAYISGVILYDETLRQKTKDGVPFPVYLAKAGMIPGIKVDLGAKPLAGYPGETITEGLDGLRDRFAEYHNMGAKFAKWRAVINIDSGIPSRYAIDTNAEALARYAALAQEAGIVPIVEPEVLMDGSHTLEQCYQTTEATLHTVFGQLYRQGVFFEGMILKPNMVLSGSHCPTQAGVEEVADATVSCLLRALPAAVPGAAFLSGGQSAEVASAHLNAMNVRWRGKKTWVLTFSFSRAILQPALDTWKGEEANKAAAQKVLYYRAKCNGMARQGEYSADMEKA